MIPAQNGSRAPQPDHTAAADTVTGLLSVNGREVHVRFHPADTLLDVLRAHGFTEVKRGCERGECGTCLVLLDGVLVNSCQVFAATALGGRVVTSVGLADDVRAARIHEAFAESGAVQCGYCTPGMVLAAWALLERNPHPTHDEIREALLGNLCRCTGYVKTVDAVALAADRLAGALSEAHGANAATASAAADGAPHGGTA